MFHILIVEDDDALRDGLAFDLTAEGYQVLTADSVEAAKKCMEQNVELALLDVNLAGGDGFMLCQEIKRQRDIPVIFLTCRDLLQDELTGFDCGADDYITKPFSMPLLRRRIAAVLKRSVKNHTYCDGFFTVDFDRLTASAGGKAISFTPTEYKLLKIFISNGGNVLTRQLLLEKLWDNEENFVDDHTLSVNINRIRGKIEDENHKYIKTVYGIGYLWNGGMA